MIQFWLHLTTGETIPVTAVNAVEAMSRFDGMVRGVYPEKWSRRGTPSDS